MRMSFLASSRFGQTVGCTRSVLSRLSAFRIPAVGCTDLTRSRSRRTRGRGRLALYETFPADAAYLESRIEVSRKHGGRAQAVVVNGHAAEVWLDETTGELLLGWTLPGKSEVLVANTADFTVARLVKSAESVSDCCG